MSHGVRIPGSIPGKGRELSKLQRHTLRILGGVVAAVNAAQYSRVGEARPKTAGCSSVFAISHGSPAGR